MEIKDHLVAKPSHFPPRHLRVCSNRATLRPSASATPLQSHVCIIVIMTIMHRKNTDCFNHFHALTSPKHLFLVIFFFLLTFFLWWSHHHHHHHLTRLGYEIMFPSSVLWPSAPAEERRQSIINIMIIRSTLYWMFDDVNWQLMCCLFKPVWELILSISQPGCQSRVPRWSSVLARGFPTEVDRRRVGSVDQKELHLERLPGLSSNGQRRWIFLRMKVIGVGALWQQSERRFQVRSPHWRVQLLAQVRLGDQLAVLGRLEYVGEQLVLSSDELCFVRMERIRRLRLSLPSLCTRWVEERILPDAVHWGQDRARY